ncbi:hypothetical protein BH09PLA1_BH09PLA1_26630 [soil metagenome]
MQAIASIHFAAATQLWIALSLVTTAMLIAAVRRIPLPRLSAILIATGMLLMAGAAGAPAYRGHSPPVVAVLVDVSPSMRGASDRDQRSLRIRQLLGTLAHQEYQFADRTTPTGSDAPVDEQPVDQSEFSPPAADAVVLFSDAQFDLPTAAPPTIVVVDPNFEDASDAAVTRLSIDHDDVTIAIRNRQGASRDARRLSVEGVLPGPSLPIGETLGDGDFVYHAKRDPKADVVVARIISDDRWPENNQMRSVAPPHATGERWWVSEERSAPTNGWRSMRASSLPLDAAAYLATSVILLDNISAEAIPPAAQHRLAQFVRELGGSLLLSGGEHSFGAGGYFSTALDDLSPLASAPPAPTRHWILLADSSGSMASAPPGSSQTRWRHAVEAQLRALPSLPPSDLVTTGSFAREARWWSTLKSVDETRRLSLPPPDVAPNGPTNLQPVLEQITSRAEELPTEVLILSDADAVIDHVDNLAKRLTAAKVRVHLLATGADPAADNSVAGLVRATGGQVLREADPASWASRLTQLMRAAMPELLARGSARVQFIDPMGLPMRSLDVWNRTWPKSETQPLATILAANEESSAGAEWNVGAGQVAALGFAATNQEILSLADRIARPPRDPRFSVRRDEGADLHITIDASENGKYLNELPLKLSLRDESDPSPVSIAITQTAPGRYEISQPTPRSSKVATIALDSRVIDRFALAGRYAREFDGIGNDRAAMRELARRTSGRVIEPAEARPLDLKGEARNIPLSSEFAFAGCALIAIGLIHWRRIS